MAFWIVYQGNSFKRSRAGGYLWAPKVGKIGQSHAYWTNMTRVQPGDLVFSGVDNAIRAVSQVTDPAYDAKRPDPRDAEHWDENGWRLDVAYTDLPAPLFYESWVPAIAAELPARHSPFSSAGRPVQGYLFELAPAAGEYILQLVSAQGVDLSYAAMQAASTPAGETVRDALVKARIGQGQFRADLLKRWGGRCAATGLDRAELLRASHIKPWSSSNNAERLDPDNGLLLAAAYDATFDALLISFRADGSIILAPDFPPATAAIAGVSTDVKLPPLSPETRSYLAAHRNLLLSRARRAMGSGTASS